MKITISVLTAVAEAALGKEMDAAKFDNAVAAFVNREKKTATVSSRSHEATKEYGVRTSATLSIKTDKNGTRDGRAIHWLTVNAEFIQLCWQKPEVPEEGREWLEKFAVIPV